MNSVRPYPPMPLHTKILEFMDTPDIHSYSSFGEN